jgi:hypothetical protein
MAKPILCIDFDGVIHTYTTKWKGPTEIPDPPVKGVFQWLNRATEFWTLNVYSSRSSQPGGIAAMKRYIRHFAAMELPDPELHEQLMAKIEFPSHKPAAFLTIDDRVICFDGNWASLDPEDLLNFKPWNKK